MYGFNDAPHHWRQKYHNVALDCGAEQSTFDPCVYLLFEYKEGKNTSASKPEMLTLMKDRINENMLKQLQKGLPKTGPRKLVGILAVHVDDSAWGGRGPKWAQFRARILEALPYRKVRQREGDFCGSHLKQLADFTIEESQSKFADKMTPLKVPGKIDTAECHPKEVSGLRGVHGDAAWLSKGVRMDLAAQTSICQGCMPKPVIGDMKKANLLVRRAKQHKGVMIRYQPIPLQQLRLVLHHDAAFQNLTKHGTQSGYYVIAFTNDKLNRGERSPWIPWIWRSTRLKRTRSSTMSAETQSAVAATGHLEWCQLMLAEIADGNFCLGEHFENLKDRETVVCTDCKSLYDHLMSVSSPGTVGDKRTAADLVVLRESISRCSLKYRWVPTALMIADGLTKDMNQDLIRGMLREGDVRDQGGERRPEHEGPGARAPGEGGLGEPGEGKHEEGEGPRAPREGWYYQRGKHY